MRRLAVVFAVTVVAAALDVLYAQQTLLERSGILAHLGRAAATGEWRGYIIAPAADRYRIVAPMDGDVWLALDGKPVIDAGMARRETWVDLRRGLNQLHLRHVNSEGGQTLDLRWSRGTATPLRIPRVLFVPDVAPLPEVQRRILSSRLAPLALAACSLLLLAGAAALGSLMLRRLFPLGGRATVRSIVLWTAVSALFATGAWWGLPDDTGWAVDEITPGEVIVAVESRFSGGWATIYPPLHYAVLAALTAPYHFASALGIIDVGDIGVVTQMFLLTRSLTVLMGVGIVVIVFRLSREIAGPRAALFSVATIVTALPLTYYAKTVNVDVPSIFWLSLALLFYSRAFAHGRPVDFYLFTAAGVVAICTKDQTYGYFILPAAHMTVAALLRRNAPAPGVPSLRVLGGMAAIAIGGLVLLDNLLFNASGFAEHVRIITGPGSQNYRMYPSTPSGQARLFVTTIRELGQAMGWPMFTASVFAVVAAFRTRVHSIRWLMLPLASYYLTLIAVVGYHYDRFFLGTIVVLAVATGWWIDRWTRDGVPWRALRTAAVATAVVYGAGRVVALDVVMLRDSRYAVEDWLVEHAAPQERIAAVGFPVYLPRASKVFWTPIEKSVDALDAEKPAFVVVNAPFSRRDEPGSAPHLFYDALQSGRAGYERVMRHRTRLWWSPLNWESRFDGEIEDEFSNLTKINPTIEIFRRVRER